MITRKITETVEVKGVLIGGGNPVVVQSMTNTDTEDDGATAQQVAKLYRSGSEIVRLTVNTLEAGRRIKLIRHRLEDMGVSVPLVGDFHYNGHKILSQTDCGFYLDKYRINPGNVGRSKKDEQFTTIINKAIEFNKPVRIGVNWGSLDQEVLKNALDNNARLKTPLSLSEIMQKALIESALMSAEMATTIGLKSDRIIISVKVSNANELIAIYQKLSSLCTYPLHVGLTEAGMGLKGVVSSAVALGAILSNGIGDTIRVSLTPKVGQPREDEVKVAKEILQALGLRDFHPTTNACPGCGRTTSTYFQSLAEEVNDFILKQLPRWTETYQGVNTLKVAVMGCVVNGPGESKMADIGISLPGKGELPVAPVYVNGVKTVTLKGANLAEDFKKIIEQYVVSTYPKIKA